MINPAGDEQLHRIERRRDVAQFEIALDVQPLLFRQRLKDDIGHVGAERHGDFLALEVGQRLQIVLARHHPQHAPGRDIEQLQLDATVVEIGGDIGRHRDKIRLAFNGQHAQLVGVFPRSEFDAVGNILQRAAFDHVNQRIGHRSEGPGQHDFRNSGRALGQNRPGKNCGDCPQAATQQLNYLTQIRHQKLPFQLIWKLRPTARISLPETPSVRCSW